jgi:excinuclease ABC subunit A
MKAADMIIDIGEAGSFGGELVAQGTLMKFWNQLPFRFKISVPKKRRKFKNFIEIKGARENNLQNIDVTFH